MHVSSLKRLELDASVVAGADVTFIHMRDAGSKTIRSAGAELSSDTEEKKVAAQWQDRTGETARIDRPSAGAQAGPPFEIAILRCSSIIPASDTSSPQPVT